MDYNFTEYPLLESLSCNVSDPLDCNLQAATIDCFERQNYLTVSAWRVLIVSEDIELLPAGAAHQYFLGAAPWELFLPTSNHLQNRTNTELSKSVIYLSQCDRLNYMGSN